MFKLNDKLIVIVGGDGVIGTEFSEYLVNEEKAFVSIWDKNFKQKIYNTDALRFEIHASNEEEVEEALNKTINYYKKPIDILVNCAGGNEGKCDFIDINIFQFERILKNNLVAGLVVPSKIMAKYWIQNNLSGNIINMASMASYIPLSGVWAYDAAKSAIRNLTMAMAKEFAKYKIRVNAIAPGFFVTNQNYNLLYDEKGELTERGKEILRRTPMERFGNTDELIGALLFLLDNNASGFVTGITLPVDGGFLTDNV